jgi:protein-histidine pros-kinase
MARPIKADAECLHCHSRPALAPATMLARYGSDNGFGWQANEIVGAQVVSVPFGRANDNIEKSLSSFMLVILSALLALWLVVNVVLYVQVRRPLRRITALADTLSLGQPGGQDFPRKGARELVALGGAFERMRKSLDKAMKLLGS